MGLGKTAQCISVMEHVRTAVLRSPRPFLVIAPLTTLGHWKVGPDVIHHVWNYRSLSYDMQICGGVQLGSILAKVIDGL